MMPPEPPDSDASGGLTIGCTDSTDGLRNLNWDIGEIGEFVWDGGGADNLASNGDNWVWDAAPSATSNVHWGIIGAKDCTWDIATTAGNWDVHDIFSNTITLANAIIIANLYHDGGTITTSTSNHAITVTTSTYIYAGSTLKVNGSTCALAQLLVNGTLNINGRATITHKGFITGSGTIKLDEDAVIYDIEHPPAMPIRLPLKIPRKNSGVLWVGI